MNHNDTQIERNIMPFLGMIFLLVKDPAFLETKNREPKRVFVISKTLQIRLTKYISELTYFVHTLFLRETLIQGRPLLGQTSRNY